MYTIRTATPDDLEAIKDVVRAAEPVDRSADVAHDGSVQIRQSLNWDDLAVAEEAGVIVGYGGLSWPLRDNARSTEIRVHPGWRRQGIGRALAQHAIRRAQTVGCNLSGAYLSTSPAAAAFVAALGTRQLGAWHFMVATPLQASAPDRPLAAGYSIRHAQKNRDEAGFAAIFNDTFSEHRFLMPMPVEIVSRGWALPGFDPSGIAFAEYNGEIVGVSSMRHSVIYAQGELVSCGHIGPVGVASAHRQRGLARALLLDNLAYARSRGWVAASLDVDETNTHAIALYRSLGFERYFDLNWWWLDVAAEQVEPER